MTSNKVKRYGRTAVAVSLLCGVLPAVCAATGEQSTTALFWPDLSWQTLAWFGAVAILAVTIRLKPPDAARTLDGLVLAGMCLLLGLRGTPETEATWIPSAQWWAYLGLTGCTIYWLARGLGLLLGRQGPGRAVVTSGGVRIVLLCAGLAVCVHQIATAPPSMGSRDGVVGGLCLAETGQLPYGEAPRCESRSPLLYIVHAGVVQLRAPTAARPEDGVKVPMTWAQRDRWLGTKWWETGDLSAARLLNAVLFIGTLLGLYVVGRALHSSEAAAMMVLVLCVFPGMQECLTKPEIMLPALLLTWTIAFALVPVVGSILATLCMVVAGFACPWIWLGLPVLLAYFWRRGWPAVGSSVALLGGAALCIWGGANLVAPTIPRADGALRMAGMTPTYQARLADDEDTVVIDERVRAVEETESRPVSQRLWRWMVTSESTTLGDAARGLEPLKIDWPNDVGGRKVAFREVQSSREAMVHLQPAYRAAVRELPPFNRVLVAMRAVLEATWVPRYALPDQLTGVWTLWGGPPPMEGSWVLARRVVRLVVALLAIAAGLLMFFGGRAQRWHLLAALVAVYSGALLASGLGPVSNLAWFVPLLMMLWAAYEPPGARPATVADAARRAAPPRDAAPADAARGEAAIGQLSATEPPITPGPPPRITLDD